MGFIPASVVQSEVTTADEFFSKDKREMLKAKFTAIYPNVSSVALLHSATIRVKISQSATAILRRDVNSYKH